MSNERQKGKGDNCISDVKYEWSLWPIKQRRLVEGEEPLLALELLEGGEEPVGGLWYWLQGKLLSRFLQGLLRTSRTRGESPNRPSTNLLGEPGMRFGGTLRG